MPFVIYDTETTGTDPAFDQVLQFAAIRADDDLNELETFEVRCRLLPYLVPSPGALLVTRQSPAVLTDPALPSHYDAMKRVHAKMRERSPTVFIGWNSITFDERFLVRPSFKRSSRST